MEKFFERSQDALLGATQIAVYNKYVVSHKSKKSKKFFEASRLLAKTKTYVFFIIFIMHPLALVYQQTKFLCLLPCLFVFFNGSFNNSFFFVALLTQMSDANTNDAIISNVDTNAEVASPTFCSPMFNHVFFNCEFIDMGFEPADLKAVFCKSTQEGAKAEPSDTKLAAEVDNNNVEHENYAIAQQQQELQVEKQKTTPLAIIDSQKHRASFQSSASSSSNSAYSSLSALSFTSSAYSPVSDTGSSFNNSFTTSQEEAMEDGQVFQKGSSGSLIIIMPNNNSNNSTENDNNEMKA